MSEYGLKIKNIAAAVLYEVNLGVREYFDYTDAMLNNSLFLYYMKKHGLSSYKDESTRDVICLSFDFGTKAYDDEIKRINKLIDAAQSEEEKEKLINIKNRIDSNKDKYHHLSREDLRTEIYEHGIDATYTNKATRTKPETTETIHYKYLFRTPAKAKVGKAMFINEKLYDVARDWLTMGLDKLMPDKNAKIVELSAYSSLTVSSIIDRMYIPVKDIVILEDQDSFVRTMVDIVRAEDYELNGSIRKKCVVHTEETDVKNTLWDGQGLIDNDSMPPGSNGMVLLRNHFFKMCGFRTNIQLFFRDWCEKTGNDYETYQIKDMFGYKHYLKDIKVITTDNAIKWKKFIDIMGGSKKAAYRYWCKRIKADKCIWGIVKTDHPSKLGQYQQMSYQMINTLPCTKEDIGEIASSSIEYIIKLKSDPDVFEAFLRKNANITNHYEMLADLYQHNHEIANSDYFKFEKSKIINEYIDKLKTGKIFVNADNLTLCGNPYALLLYSVGENWEDDPTLNVADGYIQCYTTRFKDKEYLSAFRSPHNSVAGICYLKNVYSPEMEKYFPFSKNILALNCIRNTVQSRLNGADFDSDFTFVTNNPTIVKCAEKAQQYLTSVNLIEESGLTYNNTMADYALMDNRLSSSRLGIGWSSNLAQLATTYWSTECSKSDDERDEKRIRELYEIVVTMAWLAQICIDNSKRVYAVSSDLEINRIQNVPCMQYVRYEIDANGKKKKYKYDFPKFMKYVREPPCTKNGRYIPSDEVTKAKKKLDSRINPEFVCPMNWLVECLSEVSVKHIKETKTKPMINFFIKYPEKANHKQMSKVRNIINEYNLFMRDITALDYDEDLKKIATIKTEEVINKVGSLKMGMATVNRLVETALGIENGKVSFNKQLRGVNKKYCRRLLNCIYRTNKEYFMNCFKKC